MKNFKSKLGDNRFTFDLVYAGVAVVMMIAYSAYFIWG